MAVRHALQVITTLIFILAGAALVFLVALFLIDRGKEEASWLAAAKNRARQQRIEATRRPARPLEDQVQVAEAEQTERQQLEERFEKERARAALRDAPPPI